MNRTLHHPALKWAAITAITLGAAATASARGHVAVGISLPGVVIGAGGPVMYSAPAVYPYAYPYPYTWAVPYAYPAYAYPYGYAAPLSLYYGRSGSWRPAGRYYRQRR
ncbi:MAG: hypothetical protein LBI48_09535 [Burkholderiaceae bacterium]|jgi:hypothetical protein|nr:hypothetical protein [Burkholderiaceae bacterium]